MFPLPSSFFLFLPLPSSSFLRYLGHLVKEQKSFKEAAALCPRLLKTNKEAWVRWFLVRLRFSLSLSLYIYIYKKHESNSNITQSIIQMRARVKV